MAQTYINGDLIRNLLPDISRLKDYLQYANNPDRKVRNIQPLMSVLQRLPQADLWLIGLLQTRKYATLGYNYTIKMPDGIKPSAIEEKRIAEIKNRFVKSKMRRTFSVPISARLFGQSAARLVWGNAVGMGEMVQAIHKYELTQLDNDPDNVEGVAELVSNGGGIPTSKPLDPEIHIQYYHNPLEDIQNDYVGGVMRTVMFTALLKYLDFFVWARQNEKWGDPTIWGTYKPGTDDTEIATAFNCLVALAQNNVGMTPDTIMVKLIEAQKTRMTEMHSTFQALSDKRISVGLRGQTLTTDVGSVGSKAAATVHDFVRKDFLWGDIQAIEQVESEQYIQQDWKMNYNDEPKNAYPELKFKTDEVKDIESNARVIGELMSTTEIPLKEDEVY